MEQTQINSIGILTSGGDAPGMNAAVRASVRTAVYLKKKIFLIKRGFQGMIDDDIEEAGSRSVSNIIQRGGTIIKTARSKEFRTTQGREKAHDNLKKHGIEGLVVIGGDGSFHGAVDLHNEYNIPTIGVPGTIDNDLYGTDFTIGYDTAVNTALEAIDKIRDTAASHDRFFIIEVMGRDAGFIALEAGIAGGSENILIPELPTDMDKICDEILSEFGRGKTSHIVVVAEGDDEGGAYEIGEKIKNRIGIDFRAAILGHIQRGGRPSAKDRLLASKLGHWAVRHLVDGKTNMMVGEINGKIVLTDLAQTFEKKKPIDMDCVELARILSI